jgi:SNF2 family DNA or RNA helicase
MKYRFKTTPYAHQKQAIRKLLGNGFGGALLMEPRTGKSKTTIDYLSILAQAGKVDRAVIVCPARVLDVWVQELHRHCPALYTVQVWDSRARKQALVPVQRVHELSIVLVNYEAFATPGRRLASGRRSKTTGRYAIRTALLKWASGGAGSACVLDESHKIKSPSGKAATMIVSMGKDFDYRLILTGTPVTKAKRVFDIYMQWKFLNPERFHDVPTVGDFKNRYGQWTNRNGYPQFLRAMNTKELRERIHADAFAITREECFDLPPRTTNIIRIPLTTSGPVYDQLAEQMIAEFARMEKTHLTEASIPLTLTLRLSQITGGFAKTVEGETVAVGREKLDEFERILDEAIENDEKLVVGARFRSDLDGILAMAAAKKVPAYAVRGGISRQEVTENIAAFNETEGIAVCAMNPQAGGLGIDLSSASHMVWYSLTPSWVNFTQSNDRIALSAKATTYTYLLAAKTVDEVLYDTLLTDGDLAKVITRNPRKVLRT